MHASSLYLPLGQEGIEIQNAKHDFRTGMCITREHCVAQVSLGSVEYPCEGYEQS